MTEGCIRKAQMLPTMAFLLRIKTILRIVRCFLRLFITFVCFAFYSNLSTFFHRPVFDLCSNAKRDSYKWSLR